MVLDGKAFLTWLRYSPPVRWWISWRYRREWGRRRGRVVSFLDICRKMDAEGPWRERRMRIIEVLSRPNPLLEHVSWVGRVVR